MAFLSQSSVIRLYKSVIDETIASSREAFLDEGVDEQVLIELKTLWESKVTSNKAVQITPPEQSSGANVDQMHQGSGANSSTGGPSAGASTSTNRKKPIKRNTGEQQQQQPITQSVAPNNVYQQATLQQQHQQQQQAGTSQQNVTTNGSSVLLASGGAANKTVVTNTNSNNTTNTQQTTQQQQQMAPQQQQQQQQQTLPQQTMFSSMLDPTKVVPIQITLPPQTGMQETTGRVLTIQVPATALIGNQLQQVLTGPVISATMRLPQQQASNLLQQHVNAALQGQNSPLLAKAIPQVDGSLSIVDDPDPELNIEFPDIFALARALNMCNDLKQKQRKQQIKRKRKILSKQMNELKESQEEDGTNIDTSSPNINTNVLAPPSPAPLIQLDGQNFEHGLLEDSSEDEDDVSDDVSEDEELDEDKEDEDVDIDGGGMEEEPLNSEDDVSEEDPTDLFDTENVVVCQYDKINRSRNKWKFYLKDGIMNLDGKDFIFQKITGDAEW
ncbi:transcription initiation factor IIA subunit 1 isoform X2 [Chrysoperla carnea]|uniref:transcription initiation factor IIA subunit 1 isoform X2 n=1 Tax=Chrysoperla carnea TaxID=189513 RepID=UPI001D07C1EB|nr:transcription initiation factor IIA subunit 1 isoform X2 [Chrysoperla carnea]